MERAEFMKGKEPPNRRQPGGAVICSGEERRNKLFGNPHWNGIDFLEVSENQHSLCVHFFGQIPEGIKLENISIEGGRRVAGIRAVNVEIDSSDDPDIDNCLRITLDKAGDFSTYRLCFIEKTPRPTGPDEPRARPFRGLDPRYACLDFRFKLDCPSDLDCKADVGCPPAAYAAPEINYLSKDYASFRQLMFDRLALTMPDWRERHVPDVGVTLVELLAYAADHLSYYQDAAATEAYLDTARQRVSVRRHARLVDYRMHEGCNARTWVTVDTSADLPKLLADDFYFITGFDDLRRDVGEVLTKEVLDGFPAGRYEVFEPLVSDRKAEIHFIAAHSTMQFHTWGDSECCLPKGATRATLIDGAQPPPTSDAKPAPVATGERDSPSGDNGASGGDTSSGGSMASEHKRVLSLTKGDVLIFEEVLGPTTGIPADADPAHRHAVLLTGVTPMVDGLLNCAVLEIEWAAEDALPFSLCLSARLSAADDCRRIPGVSVARGNVVLVDHGRRVPPDPLGPVQGEPSFGECACEGSLIETTMTPTPFRAQLKFAPLTYGVPLGASTSATAMLAQDPRAALPEVRLEERVSAGEAAASWRPRYDLLASGGGDRHFVVEMDDDRRAHLRFGDGESGYQPFAGTLFDTHYRVGYGPAGNVGRDTIAHLVNRKGLLSRIRVLARNPLPAQGGTAPEPIEEVKLFAPGAFRKVRARAITAEDYADLAQRNSKIQRAAAELSWAGSWYEARVAVDPVGSETAEPELLKEIKGALHPYRRIGHDLAVVPARYVPLTLTLRVCVLPHYARGEVKAALLTAFSNRRLAGGTRGFFHPDSLSFGGGVYLSQVVAAAKAVEGVESVTVERLQRFGAPEFKPSQAGEKSSEIANGVLPLNEMEIGQLDNDPNFPENGTLILVLGGGR